MEVTNCFCVPHKEYEDHVEAELQYAQDMFELNKKVKLNETIFFSITNNLRHTRTVVL